MTDLFHFTIMKFVEDPIRNEPINIGILVNKNGDKCFGNIMDLQSLKKIKKVHNPKSIEGFFNDISGYSDPKDLKKWITKYQYQIQFTVPNVIQYDNIESASAYLFNMYVKSQQIQPQTSELSSRIRLQKEIQTCVKPELLEQDIAKFDHKIIGSKHVSMRVDSHFKNNEHEDVIHCLSFADSIDRAVNDAIIKSNKLEQLREKFENMNAYMFLKKPLEGISESDLEQFEYAQGMLKDCRWIVHGPEKIPKKMTEIQEQYVLN